MTIEDARQNFISFIGDYEEYHASDISESDTRSKLIDYIFINILGWDEKNIQREGHVEHGYYDYRFSIPSLHFIVEAKKQLVTLTLPEKNYIASISTLYPENKEIIDQIRRYLVDEGIAFGIITNGQQFIIGQFVNQNGNPWKQNKCLLFNGYSDDDITSSEYLFGMYYYYKTKDPILLYNIATEQHYDTNNCYQKLEY